MNISEIKIFIVNEERLKAYVTITLDACFVVRDLKIIQGPGGLFDWREPAAGHRTQ